MSDFGPDGCLEGYRRLMARAPERLRNPSNALIRILTDESDIKAAVEAEAARRRAAGEPEGDLRVGVLLEDRYLGAFVRDAVVFGDGSFGLYNRILGIDGCVVLPVLEGRVVMIRIFRHAARSWVLEFPGGAIDPVVAPEEAARAELAEEVGGIARKLEKLGALYPQPALSSERYHLFAAEIDGIGRPQAEEGIAEILSFAPSEIEAMIDRGEIADLPSVAIFSRARMRGLL